MTDLKTSVASVVQRLDDWRERYFPERQLFLRSQGRVRFLTIHSYTQVALSAIGVVALGWGMVTSYAYLTRDSVLEDKNKTITAMSSQYETLSSDFSALEAEVERRTRLLEQRHEFLQDLLKEAPAAAPSLLPLAEADAVGTPIMSSDAAGGPLEVIEADGPAGNTEQPAQNITTETDDTPHEEDPELSFLENWFGGTAEEDPILNNIGRRQALLARLEKLDQQQRAVAGALINAANNRLGKIDETMTGSGVTLAAFADAISEPSSGLGGPYEPDTSAAFEGVFKVDDGKIYSDLLEGYYRLKMVTNALDSYPHGQPAGDYYVSSRFGRRIDPIKKTWARHRAVDLSGWPGTPITATAPGVITHAGWFGPYGNMVEIDHGNGFKTRYGHMRKLNVKKNEEVAFGQQLGEMGSTGRVTGTHVHYEVRFQDELLDPLRFMKASENVLEIQGRYEQQGE